MFRGADALVVDEVHDTLTLVVVEEVPAAVVPVEPLPVVDEALHDEAPAADVKPEAHAVQDVAPLREYVFAAQDTQTPELRYFPAEHDEETQEVAPADEVCPEGQAVQDVAVPPAEYVLAPQVAHAP